MFITTWLEKWHRWQESTRNALHNSFSHRIFGARIFHYRIWAVNVKSLAGGLSLGLFIAFTPTIPFQMTLCAAGALILHVNLPIALAACWITNPLTAYPIYMSAYRLGRLILTETQLAPLLMDFFDFGFDTITGTAIMRSLYLWAGSLVFSSISAIAGNLLVRLLAIILQFLKLRSSKRLHHQAG